MGHKDMRAYLLNGPEAAGRLSPKVESWFTHTLLPSTHKHRELIFSWGSDKLWPSLSPSHLPSLSHYQRFVFSSCSADMFVDAVAVWPKRFALGNCAYFMNCCSAALWILVEGVRMGRGDGGRRREGTLVAGIWLGCVTSILMIKLTSSRKHWGRPLSIVNLFSVLLLCLSLCYTNTQTQTHTNSHKHTHALESCPLSFPFLSLYQFQSLCVSVIQRDWG